MKTANIILTSRCNQRCPFCFYSEVKEKNLAYPDAVKWLNQLYSDGVRSIILTGGEPGVYKNLSLIIEEIFRNNFNMLSIHSNGSIIKSNSAVDLMLKFKEKIQLTVSLHGSCSSLHDSIVSSAGSFDKAYNLLSWSKHNKIKTSVNFAIMKNNSSDMSSLLELTKQLKVSITNLLLVHDCTKNLQFKENINYAVNQIIKNTSSYQFRTDGIPYCLLRGHEEIVGEAYWPRNLSVISLKAKKYDYYSSLIHELRYWPKPCESCMMRNICMGVYNEYKTDFDLIYPGPILG